MAEGRIICCCTATTGARVIAWLEIILNGLLAILLIMALAGVALLAADAKKHPDDPKVDMELTAAAIAVLIIGLVFCVVGILFGIILLKGANQRRPAYLRIWIIFSVIGLIWSVTAAALSEDPLVYKIVRCTVQILVNGFGIWVVYVLKKEIQDEIYAGEIN